MSYYMMDNALVPMSGFGMFYGFGAIDFNAEAVWSDWVKGGASANRAAKSIQAGLNQLGYGLLNVDGIFGPKSRAALKAFSLDNGFGSQDWPTKPILLKMAELIKTGTITGPSAPVESHIVGGEFVPGPAPGAKPLSAKAGLTTGQMLGIGALVLVGIGALAVLSKPKRQPGAAPRKAA